jgi:putative ABC transport system permease protein
MLKNYLISAWRNITRSKVYTFINIFCLSVGITGAIFIVMFLEHELSYDTHHANHESIYRIDGFYQIGGSTSHLAITPFPLGPALKQEFSEVKEYVRLFLQAERVVRIGERKFLESDLYYADSTIFNVFTHPFIYGNPSGALSEPKTIVLTQSLSQKYFGDTIPINKNIEIDRENYRVTGVIEDLPSNSHVKFSALISMISFNNEMVYSLSPQLFWSINTNYTYIQMHDDTSAHNMLNNMDAFNQKYISTVGDVIGAKAHFEATPLRETHFKKIQSGQPTGNKSNLMIFSVVAVFLIVIAAVNYTNLATARASSRAREIAMRKVSGATRSQLVSQFLSESLLVAFVSLLLSLLIVEIFIPGFNRLAEGTYSLANIINPTMMLQVVGITVFTGVISGVYPALYLSTLKPADILKGQHNMTGGSGNLRKALVVFQFAISVLLIAGTITVQRQLSYLQNKDLGFNRHNRFTITLNAADSRDKMKSLQNTVEQNPDIISTAITFSVPGRGLNKNAVKVQSGTEMVESAISTNFIDHSFLDVFEIPLVMGRNFDREMVSDVDNSILINETAVSFFGWQDDPLGKTIQWMFNEDGEPQMTLKVIGVVKDFNYVSLQNHIEPIMMLLVSEPPTHRALVVEYFPGKGNEVLAYLEQVVREFDPGRIPNIFSVDHGFLDEFDSEEKLGNIFGIFALVCIVISFMGLFGLSSYLTEQRKKEIGVRKVLGSTGWSILAMFYREFSWLVIIAIILAAPIAWLLMDWWLGSFLYSIRMSSEPIILSALLAFLVALITVSYHTLRASRLNPVDAIRAE